MSRIVIGLLFGAVVVGTVVSDEPAVDPAQSQAVETDEPAGKKETAPRRVYTGKVVLLKDALKQRGIASYEENAKQVVLETFDGRLFPIVADWRGRAFYQDDRLRDRKVELVCYERPGIPYLQVLAVYTFDDEDRRTYTDYWCDICAIPMYEVKPCDCCQEETRLRFQVQELPDYLEGRHRIPIGRKPDPGSGTP